MSECTKQLVICRCDRNEQREEITNTPKFSKHRLFAVFALFSETVLQSVFLLILYLIYTSELIITYRLTKKIFSAVQNVH